jgi:hypothetical protein
MRLRRAMRVSSSSPAVVVAGAATARGGGSALFRACLFVDSVGAIAHEATAAAQDLLESCYFVNTSLKGSTFDGGSVLVLSCLFAGEGESLDARFEWSGVQVNFASINISSTPPR